MLTDVTNSNSKDSWSVIVTPKLKGDIKCLALAAYSNACRLLKDAKLLKDSYATSEALSILADEEFSKAFICLICVQEHRWDSEIYYGLKKHPEKQGVADAIREYMEWFIKNRDSLLQMNQSILPNDMHLIIEKTKLNIVKKQKKDRYKQSLLYVGFDRNACITSEPNKVSCRNETESCLKKTELFKETVEIMLSVQIEGFVKVIL